MHLDDVMDYIKDTKQPILTKDDEQSQNPVEYAWNFGHRSIVCAADTVNPLDTVDPIKSIDQPVYAGNYDQP